MGLIHIVSQLAVSNNNIDPENDWKAIILWFKIVACWMIGFIIIGFIMEKFICPIIVSSWSFSL